MLDVFYNRAAHLRWLTVETADGQASEPPTTDSHPFWVHERHARVEAGAPKAGLTFSGPHQQPVKLRSTRLEEFPELRPVYTPEVHDYPKFFVLPAGSFVPVLVHNNKKCVKTGKGTKGNATDGANSQKKDKLPEQEHHYVTNKNKKYTPEMHSIACRYGLDLDEERNKELLPHLGRHPNDCHDFVLRGMKRAAKEAGNNVGKVLELYEKYGKQLIRSNPDLLRKYGWE